MDPNANLLEALRIVRRLIDEASEHDGIDCAHGPRLADAERLADLVEALDGWISGGGFLPDRWQRGNPAGAATGGQLWAAYSGTATGDGISLHATERDALMAVATGLGIDEEDEDRGPLSGFDDDDLREVFDAYCQGRADDWSVQEVTLP